MAIPRLSRLAFLMVLVLACAGTLSEAGGRKTNVIVSGVRAVPTWYSTEARLLAVVVDHEGRGLQGIAVAVLSRDGEEVSSGVTGPNGTLLLNVAVLGRVTVRASHVGFVTAEARDVEARKSSLTAVALPLEVVEVTEPLTSH